MSRIGIYASSMLLVALGGYVLFVKLWHEHRAKECNALIGSIEMYQSINGRYPKSLAEIGAQGSNEVCHYQLTHDGYIFVLSEFTLQAYEYTSTTQKWHWD
jgi:hypothetical protein